MNNKKSILLPLLSIPALCLIFPVAAYALFGSSKVIKAGPDAAEKRCGPRVEEPEGLPQEVKSALVKIAANPEFGAVTLASAYRNPRNNRCRGGARSSEHMRHKAADFYVKGYGSRSKQQKLGSFLSTTGLRFNIYCSGRAHVDNRATGNGNWSTCVHARRGSKGGRASPDKSYSRQPHYKTARARPSSGHKQRSGGIINCNRFGCGYGVNPDVY
jgi:hypothetical protein